MPKYLITASYTTEGIKGVVAKGGTGRKTAIEASVGALGGTLESFYFGFGGEDAYVLVDLPDNATAAALGLQVGASGMATTRTVVLLTPEEIDRAANVPNAYRPPGT